VCVCALGCVSVFVYVDVCSNVCGRSGEWGKVGMRRYLCLCSTVIDSIYYASCLMLRSRERLFICFHRVSKPQCNIVHLYISGLRL
jgi:hypothetical protein